MLFSYSYKAKTCSFGIFRTNVCYLLLAVFLFSLLKRLHMVIIPLKGIENILRHELELKWKHILQTPHPLGFNDNIYYEGNISRLPDFLGRTY